MRDELDARAWNDHHRQLSGAAALLWGDIGKVLDRIHRYHFDAPWQRDHEARRG